MSLALVGISFLPTSNTGENIFSIPFNTPVDIASQQTKIFKAEIERLPKPARSVTVEELKNPVKPAPQERIVITLHPILRRHIFAVERCSET